jgi:phenylpropionate dioxygenase-like ring-hydroxylating dioxygenase large terminal subunit
MSYTIAEIIESYNHRAPLGEASTIPAVWYTHHEIAEMEHRAVFGGTWQMAGRAEQVASAGQFLTTEVGREPVLVARGEDGELRAFFNVCRHHAAIVENEAEGTSKNFRCSYHGWTYGTDGALKGMTEFEGVRNFERASNGLAPIRAETWENFVFVNLNPQAESLMKYVGKLAGRVGALGPQSLRFFQRRSWIIHCNWKVYVDNYLDGGYHIPHMHKGLNSVIDYTKYAIECEEQACIQTTPLEATEKSEATAASTRKGSTGYYVWLYPNFMINIYEGVMDTNLVRPLTVDTCEVIFDYYFADVSKKAEPFHQASIRVADQVQDEDIAICESVQRGLHSRSYQAGRLSARREGGEHLFHRLLYRDLKATLPLAEAGGA